MQLSKNEREAVTFCVALVAAMRKKDESIKLGVLEEACTLQGTNSLPDMGDESSMAVLIGKLTEEPEDDTARVIELVSALDEFIECINNTGGITINDNGFDVPAVDEEWSDLGSAYIKACEAARRQPLRQADDEEDDNEI